jgi:hypothetical protein
VYWPTTEDKLNVGASFVSSDGATYKKERRGGGFFGWGGTDVWVRQP